MLTKRVPVLFNAELWEILSVRAKRERSSVSELVRRAVKKIYFEKEKLKGIKRGNL